MRRHSPRQRAMCTPSAGIAQMVRWCRRNPLGRRWVAGSSTSARLAIAVRSAVAVCRCATLDGDHSMWVYRWASTAGASPHGHTRPVRPVFGRSRATHIRLPPACAGRVARPGLRRAFIGAALRRDWCHGVPAPPPTSASMSLGLRRSAAFLRVSMRLFLGRESAPGSGQIRHQLPGHPSAIEALLGGPRLWSTRHGGSAQSVASPIADPWDRLLHP